MRPLITCLDRAEGEPLQVPMDMASVQQVASGLQGLSAAAASGGFAVSEDAGSRMIAAINKLQAGLNSARVDFRTIEQGTPLGTSPAGLRMAQFNAQVASGDARSARHALERFHEVLEEAKAAIEQAMRNYRDADTGSRGAVNAAGM